MEVDDPGMSPRRRRFFQTVSLIPVAAVLPACSDHKTDAATSKTAYHPTFFHAKEWAFILASVDHLLPADDLGPGAVEAGVPEFLDRHMNTPYAAGDIWYMQGPFLKASSLFGYQGRLALRDILRVGMKSFDDHCTAHFGGRTFAQLGHDEQLQLLQAADGAKLDFGELPAKTFFDYYIAEVKNGYFADPHHGGNKDMIGWKSIAYPGMRGDYRDWVTVRDKPYPLPPVDLAGRRA